MKSSSQLEETKSPLPGQGWRVPISLLGYREFFMVWAAGSLHIAIAMFEAFANSLYVFDQTKSPFYVALLFLTRLLPLGLLGSIAGVLAGRFNRRSMLLLGYSLLCVVYTILTVLAFFELIQLWHIYLGIFINGTVMAFDWPVRHTMMGELAGPYRTGSAMSLDMATRMAMYLLGPIMGGVVFQLIGIPGIYLFACLIFIVALSLAWAVPNRFAAIKTQSRALLPELLQGFRYARANRIILAVLGLTMMLNIFGVHALQAMVPVIGVEVYRLSPTQIGLLLSTAGFGGLLGSIGSSMYAHANQYRRLFLGGTALFFITMFLIPFFSVFWILSLLLFLGGIGLSFFGGMQPTLLLLESSAEMRSRVMGLLVFCIGAAPVGMLMTGILAEWLGASKALAFGGGAGIVLLFFSLFFWPEMYRK